MKIDLQFSDCSAAEVQRLLIAAGNIHAIENAHSDGTTLDKPTGAAKPATKVAKAKAEAAPTAPEPASTVGNTPPAYPLGGVFPTNGTLDDVKARATLFMNDPQGGGPLMAKRLAEFVQVSGAPVAKISELPPEMYGTFVNRLVPDGVPTKPAADSLLD